MKRIKLIFIPLPPPPAIMSGGERTDKMEDIVSLDGFGVFDAMLQTMEDKANFAREESC